MKKISNTLPITLTEISEKVKAKKKSNVNEEDLASLTHFLYNFDTPEALPYKKQALNFVQVLLRDKYPEKVFTAKAIKELVSGLAKEYQLIKRPLNSRKKSGFTFIDLFAGIGGFRVAFQNLGGRCVFTSEWEESAQQTYYHNYGELPFGDITKSSIKRLIPKKFDLLCAGFPCQAFSIAGKRGGFNDTRGTLFYDVAEIIKTHKPKAIFLENVKGLRSHQKGQTLDTILNVLRNDLNYYVPEPKIINAKHFGVPQNRERIYIVGFRKDICSEGFEYPLVTGKEVTFKQVKQEDVSVKYFMSTQYLNTLRAHRARHASKGNGFGFEIIPDSGIANAIVVGGMGRERNLVIDHNLKSFTPITKIKGVVNKEGIRRMTPREWARLQGFPEAFDIIAADASAYKHFGNSVAVPAIQATGEEIIKRI